MNSSSFLYADLIEECEALIRNGQTAAVAKRLARLKTPLVPVAHRLGLASVCRRAGLIGLGLKLLAPFFASVNDQSEKLRLPVLEAAEYAALLFRIGASQEASKLLKSLGSDAPPEALLLKGRIAFEEGDHAAAERDLKNYLKLPIPPARRLSARMKLGEIFLGTRQLLEARSFLDDTIQLAHSAGTLRSQSAAYVARARLHLLEKNVRAANEDLGTASSLIGETRAKTSLPILFAASIARSIEISSAEPLRELRAEALARRQSSTVREIDALILDFDFDQSDFDYLYFGSPQLAFRERLKRTFGKSTGGSAFVLGSLSAPCFDIRTGELSGSTIEAPGRQTHQMIEILLRDFYEPVRIGSLFEELFSGERYDVFSSAHRVHQVLLRTRSWLRESGIPAEIVNDAGGYSLRLTGPFAFRVPLERRPVDRNETQLEALREKFNGSWGFSARDARELLGLSSTSFKRFAAWALKTGGLERHGASSATFYKIAERNSQTAARAA